MAVVFGPAQIGKTFTVKAIDLHSEDWLWGLPGAWHCTWLACSGDFDRTRTAGEKNAALCAELAGLHEQTFVFATQALVGRLAWATGDPKRKTLDEMQGFAKEAVKIGKRSGHHYFYTCALLEAGRCAAARAGFEGDRYAEHAANDPRARRFVKLVASREARLSTITRTWLKEQGYAHEDN